MQPHELPDLLRSGMDDHLQEVAGEDVDAGQIAEARTLAPLIRIQTAFDQMANHVSERVRHPHGLAADSWEYMRAEVEAARRHAATLRLAADAADSLFDTMTKRIKELEKTTMAKKKADEKQPPSPDLTTTPGAPHPLQKGGYDPEADPELPGGGGDIEKLKEGHPTKAQTEAMNEAKAEEDEEDEAEEKKKSKKKK